MAVMLSAEKLKGAGGMGMLIHRNEGGLIMPPCRGLINLISNSAPGTGLGKQNGMLRACRFPLSANDIEVLRN